MNKGSKNKAKTAEQATRWYAMDLEEGSAAADIYVFGEVTSWPWLDSDVSAHSFVSDLNALGDLDEIRVHINSYGGEVAEGIAIYNALLSNTASVTTICEGMACSIASVIFMAGDERVMRDASLLYVHDCWTYGSGDADDMRKLADDLDKQNALAKSAYARSGLAEERVSELMREDTFISAAEALDMGFATMLETSAEDSTQQSALADVARAIARRRVAMEISAEQVEDMLWRALSAKRGHTAQEGDDERISALEDAVADHEDRIAALEADEADLNDPDDPDDPADDGEGAEDEGEPTEGSPEDSAGAPILAALRKTLA